MTRTVVAGLGLIAACAAMGRIPNLAEAPRLFLLLFTGAFLCYVAGVWLGPAVGERRAVMVVLIVAVAARIALLATPPSLSTDAYRYVWDARVGQAGISPYRYPPWAKELEPLRDAEVFPRLNHPTWRTIYPPGAQLFFRAVYRLRPDSVLAMKVALGLAELIGLAALCGLLRSLGRPLHDVVIYAWNPLVLVEIWASAHLDALILPVLIAATWAAVRSRHALAAGLLGLGALVKLYPAALLPLLPIAAWPAAAATFGAVVLAGYLPALLTGASALGSLGQYMAEEYFNPGLLRALFGAPGLSLVAAVLWVGIVGTFRRDQPLPDRAVPLIGGLLVLSPNLFPWYALPLVPFLAVAPSIPWIAFTGTVALAYTFFFQQPWAIPWWARLGEFTPLLIGAVWWLKTWPVHGSQEQAT